MAVSTAGLSRIDVVMSASHCKNHKSKVDEPCWTLQIGNGDEISRAVCGNRIRRAGFASIAAASVAKPISDKLK